MGQGNQKYTLDQGEDFEQAELLWRKRFGIISTSRGKSEGRLDGAKEPRKNNLIIFNGEG